LLQHTPRRQWFRVKGSVSVRTSGALEDQPTISCVIPGDERQGEELVAETLTVDEQPPLRFELSGRCAYASTFDYRGP